MHFGWLSSDETPHGAPHIPCSDLNHKQSLLQLTLKICSSQWVFWQLSPSLIWHSIVLLCFGGKWASRANKASWNLRPMESRRYQTHTVLFVSKRDTFPQRLYWNVPFWRVSETLWMMAPGNTNGLFLLLPSTQEVVQRQTSFALEDCLLFLKKARAVVGGTWVVGEKGSSYSDFFLDFWGSHPLHKLYSCLLAIDHSLLLTQWMMLLVTVFICWTTP